MTIDLPSKAYVPTIFLRLAELRAVYELPAADKDDLAPIFILRPWLSSKHLERAVEKIENAFKNRPYFLDLDPYYTKHDDSRPANGEFWKLLDAEDSFLNWRTFVADHKNVNPCLRLEGGETAVAKQIQFFTEMERTILAHLVFGVTANARSKIEQICETDHSNFGFVVDVGWGRDILSRELWASSLISVISNLRPEIPIIVTGSSFPDSFVEYQKGEAVSLDERRLFANLARQHNAAHLIYGDWGSSRKPTERGGGTPAPRIDLPGNISWTIFRNSDANGAGYITAASDAMGSDNWNHSLDIWGTYMIRSTAIGDPYTIDSPQKSTAVRINIHLHTQLRFDGEYPPTGTDEPYQE